MLKEFRDFAIKGNAIDLAVGVIIGGAFGKIVSSIVNDLIMPLISLLLGRVSFTNMFLALDGNAYKTIEDAKAAGVATFNYGTFIQTVVDFLIIAFVVFLLIRTINRLRKTPAPAPAPAAPETKECPFCTMQVPINARRCPHCTSQL